MKSPLLLLLLATIAAACRDTGARVETCADPLDGVWRTEDARRYEIMENRTGIEIFAMFDTTAPPDGDKRTSPVTYAPVVFDLRRWQRPSAVDLSGRRSQRMTRDGKVCVMRTKAKIERCEKNAIVLRYERPGEMSWDSCKAAGTGEWVEVSLKRE